MMVHLMLILPMPNSEAPRSGRTLRVYAFHIGCRNHGYGLTTLPRLLSYFIVDTKKPTLHPDIFTAQQRKPILLKREHNRIHL
jgi:hypothetical protein